MTDYQETLQLLRRREAEIERLADQNDVLRTALERLQRFDFECRRDGIEPLPAAVVRIIDTALAA
jgi:triphosphoribosyl-dephospho-CoA synthetase